MNTEDSTPQGPVGPEGPEAPRGTIPPPEFFVYLTQTIDDEPDKFYILASVRSDTKALAHGRLDVIGEMVNKLIEVNGGVKENQRVVFSFKKLAKYEEESKEEESKDEKTE